MSQTYLEFLSFEIRICFEFRYSNFEFMNSVTFIAVHQPDQCFPLHPPPVILNEFFTDFLRKADARNMGSKYNIFHAPELALRRQGLRFKDIEHRLDSFHLKDFFEGLLVGCLSSSHTEENSSFLHQSEFPFSQKMVSLWRKWKDIDEVIHLWNHLPEIIWFKNLIYILHRSGNSFYTQDGHPELFPSFCDFLSDVSQTQNPQHLPS